MVRYRIKRSEFIGFIVDCDSVDCMNSIINDYKRKYRDARHICYSVILGDNEIFGNDGEPYGTSGIAMLNELKKRDIKNRLVIIVRYFGGIKLGRSLLRETYCNVTKSILDKI